jgi:undecaprenyl-diphosphatase
MRLAVMLIVPLAAGIFLWLATITTMPHVLSLNREIVQHTAELRTPLLNAVMFFFTRLGNPWVIASLLIVLSLVLLYARRWIEISGVAVAGGGAWLLTELLKQFYQRARPALGSTPLDVSSYSFPSAHALGSMVGYGMLLWVGLRLIQQRWCRWLLLSGLPPVIFFIGVSRVYFGVHFLTDVLAGFLIGLAWLIVSVGLVWALDYWRVYRMV